MALIAILVVGCDDSGGRLDVSEAPPPAAALAPGAERGNLTAQLDALDAELARVEAGAGARLLSAEAITDQLLHARRPVDWLEAGYDIEARLRQLQAAADRIVALLRRGASLHDVADDVAGMRRAVNDLQTQLHNARGGPAPPSLDSLLAQDPLRDVQAASLRAMMAARDSMERELPDIEPRIGTVQSRGLLEQPIRALPDTTPRPR